MGKKHLKLQGILKLGQSRDDKLRRVTLKVDGADIVFALQVLDYAYIRACVSYISSSSIFHHNNGGNREFDSSGTVCSDPLMVVMRPIFCMKPNEGGKVSKPHTC